MVFKKEERFTMILRFIYIILLASIAKSFNLNDKSFDLNSRYNQSIGVQHETLEQRKPSLPLEDLINENEYIFGPGDGVYINIVTSNKIVNLNLFVSPTGDILIPVVGIVNVNGLTLKNGFLKMHKDNGLVRDVFTEEQIHRLSGYIGIGHVRYPTAGKIDISEAQPFYVNSPHGIVLVHNGNLVNTAKLRKELLI